MSYQVLARKWRPRTFHELVGQEHVQRALVNALDQGRLHHAYLFTGTRGVGKTTLARILAKCLNCETGVTSTPCGQCSTCREIDEGRFVDLIEVDAASRTKVEDTRELLDNVQYAPTQGRYKVYLIDEVHMLSTHSFNALLKTLEEPPPHVKFLLATTDPQKLPVTVLSRCLQFTLKNMPPERIVGHLSKVLEAEQVTFEETALWLLGKAADGSMRDALSLTDQAIAFGQGQVNRSDVAAMLGTLDQHHLLALAEALAEVDAARVLAEVASLAEQGPDFAGMLDELAGIFHRLAIAQMVPEALDNGHGDRDALLALAARFTAEDVQLYYQIGLQGRSDMDSAPDARTALEMTLLRMLAFRPQGVPKPPQTPLPLRGEQQAGGSEPSPPAAEAAKPELASSVESEIPPQDDAPPPWEALPEASEPEQQQEPEAQVEPEEPAETRDMPSEAAVSPALSTPAEPPAAEIPPAATGDTLAGEAAIEEAAEAATAEAVAVVDQDLESQAEPEPEPDLEPVVIDSASGFDHAAWLETFPRLALSGLTRNLAAHCVIEQDDGQRLSLRLDPSQAAMNAEVHVERVRKALAEVGVERKIVIEAGELPDTLETPKARSDREAAQRHGEAVEALRGDPHIQQLEQAFDARLLEQTVAPQTRAQ
ncbi:DNA polymerase III, gamma subunit /DNA polymerase III, tau subunit [Modicisalibacter muralis]|uniref:DNA polymerase III subunit gamma/tau n=1 Tax=Modicisalibacter muralis TaxID=119000 RepID=A0A1G9F5F5_9GAMM|nr:DNA polymerase III subunit gamma/tau [Halomonas muralis]SDK83616.1 DNA polymerase III, gamma subunit /DNA polymerase III, tau subunit [Halomonas muralis]